jgi:hypothetical protein
MLMVMFITVNGKTIKPMDLEFIITLMAQDMKASGLKISSMVLEKKFGQTALVMKVNTKTVRNMVMESSSGLMDQHIQVTS